MENDPPQPPRPGPLDDILDGTMVQQAPKRRGWSWERHQEQFTADEKAREQLNQSSLDNLFWLPMLAYLVALFSGDASGTLLAYAAELLAVAIWTPWTIYRVSGYPRGDPRRASAILAYGLVLWPFAPLLWLAGNVALLIGFPVLYVWNGAAILIAARTRPPPRTPESYANLLSGAAVIYFLLALACGVMAFVSYKVGFGFFGFIVCAGFAFWLGSAGLGLLDARPPPGSTPVDPKPDGSA